MQALADVILTRTCLTYSASWVQAAATLAMVFYRFLASAITLQSNPGEVGKILPLPFALQVIIINRLVCWPNQVGLYTS